MSAKRVATPLPVRSLLAPMLTKRRLTYKELQRLTRISPSYISRMAKGDRLPRVDTALEIAFVLNCKVEDLWSLQT